MKRTIAVTVDEDVLEGFKRKVGRGHLSSELNDFMRRTVEVQNSLIAEQDAAILDIEFTKQKKEMEESIARFQALEKKKNDLAAETERLEIERLRAEKERLDDLKKCRLCGIPISEDAKKVKLKEDFYICRGCFIGAPAEKIARLSERG